ncbi:hypothetical protein TRFO_40213 [Tritrichomonas foetus]|uniref:USP domain-containing protein n=1 Tax=Tritrichomonas foetus TaxID=1144522 RepID=A0A1J4J1W8_9EUKA|nr:hypothetical protein TRFO_40213 [Tritrichomonas foetus]|eukprot:OHS93496.1 hypothetical protein TRFO_40213 [Tritrichomonas foetus]
MSSFNYTKIFNSQREMLQPEEDFETWIVIIQSVCDSPPDLMAFVPDIDRLLLSIENTNELPEIIKTHKNAFINLVTRNILPSLLRQSSQPEAIQDQIFDIFKIVIRFSLFGLKSNNDSYASICNQIISKKDHNLFNNNQDYNYFDKIMSYMKELNYDQEVINILKNGPKSVSIINFAFSLLHNMCVIDFWELTYLCIDALLNLLKEVKIRTIPTQDVFTFFEQMRTTSSTFESIDKLYVFKSLDTIKQFISCDIFEKQHKGLIGLSYFITEPKTLRHAVAWFSENPENLNLFNGKDLHPEFISSYTAILSELAASDILTDKFIEELWSYHNVQHSTQLLQYFMIFDAIAARISVEKIDHLINLCIKPEEISESWIKLLEKLGETLGKRNDSKESFLKIRNELLNLVFSKDSTFSKVAENSLIHVISFYLDSDELIAMCDELKEKCQDKTLYYKLLGETLKVKFNNKEYAEKTLREAIEYLLTLEDKEFMYPFLFNVCFYNEIKIPDDLLDQIFQKCQECPPFYFFINSLVTGELISFEYIENYLFNCPDTTKITQHFTDLTKAFISKVNQYTNILKNLPLKSENILWKWAATDSPQRFEFSRFLTSLYASNDGIQLKDRDMINEFIKSWNENFNKYDKSNMLNIMSLFITQIEDAIDISFFTISRHDPSFSSKLVKVTVNSPSIPSNQEHHLPVKMKLSAVKYRIAKTAMIPKNSFSITCGQQYIHDTDTIIQLSKGNDSLSLGIRMLDQQNLIPEQHERQCIPSQILSQNDQIMEKLMSLLKENNKEAKQLLQYLPTNQNTLMKVIEIKKRNTFNYREFLPNEYPQFFEYNFETLISNFDDDLKKSFDRTYGYQYLVNSIVPPLYRTVIPFLTTNLSDDLKKSLGQTIFDRIYPTLLEMMNEQYEFNFACDFLKKIAEISKDLVLNENLYDSVSTMILSEQQFVKESTKELFIKIKIPISAFTNILDKANDDIYLAAAHHITEFNQTLYEKAKSDFASAPLLTLLQKFLEKNLIPESEKLEITKILIEKYFKIDSPPRTKEAFIAASKCMYHLQNDELLNHLSQLHDGRTVYKDWRLDGDSTTVSPTGFSGLVNLGATCFLNSTLQQFFAIPPLRKAIIEYSGTDAFMIQLRNVYAKMLLSEGHSVTTENLVKEWTGWDGEKMNPCIQQDACEFVQMLIDKLEGGLGRDFVNGLFGGTTVDTIEGISDEYKATRSQPFSTFTLPVKGFANFAQAIEIVPDFFTGNNQYMADTLNKKIDAKKWQSIGKVPPYLIISLNRFTYNYNTMERLKIDSPFEFPIDLDLTPNSCEKDQILKFKLKGVILHSGTAMFGHYISYVNDRKSGKWLCCNDSRVSYIEESKVLENAYGKTSSMSGYLLFYDRIDTISEENYKINEPEISDEIKESVSLENKLNLEYSLFCSTAYFELMKNLANSDNENFVFLSIRYFFDTYPFTTHTLQTDRFTPSLIEKIKRSPSLKERITNYLENNGPYQCSLAYCPSNPLRSASLEIISLIPTFPDTFMKNAIDLSGSIMPYYQCSKEYFLLLAEIASRRVDFAFQNGLEDILVNFLTIDIPKHLTEHPEITPKYFYGGFDFTGIFKALTSMGTSDNFFKYLLDDQIFKYILSSSTSTESFVNLLKIHSEQEQVDSYIRGFTSKCGIMVDFYKLTKVLFEFYGANSFEIIYQGRFKTRDGSVGDPDISRCIVAEAQSSREFRKELLENLDKWLLRNLINTNNDVILDAMYVVAFLAPHSIFSTLYTLPYPSMLFSNVFGFISFIPEYCAESEMSEKEKASQTEEQKAQQFEKLVQIRETSNRILDFLKENMQNVIDKLAENPQLNAINYVQLIYKLSIITERDEFETLLNFADRITVHKPFDQVRREVASILIKNKPELIRCDYLVKSCGDLTQDLDNVSFGRIIIFLDHFLPIVEQLNPPLEFVKYFLKNCAFTNSPHSNLKFQTTAKIVESFSKLFPEVFLEFIKNDFDRIVKKNYSSLLITLKTIGKKMDLLKYLKNATTVKQFFNISDLVINTFKCNNGDIDEILDLVTLLNNPELNNEARTFIWEQIYIKKPSFISFKAAYSWKSDHSSYSRYLLDNIENEESLNNNEIFDSLIECCKNSIESLEYAFNYITSNEKAKDIIRTDDFAHSILRQKISQNQEETVIKYVLFVIDGRNEEGIDRLLQPLQRTVITLARFITNVLEDPVPDAITSNDILPLFSPLRIFSNLQMGMHPILSDLGKLKFYVGDEKTKEMFNFAEMHELEILLRKAILV